MVKATKEHNVLPNVLNRNFKQNIPGKVLLTDITYLFYKNKSKKAYLSTIKDGSTNEIMAYNVSDSLTLDIVIDTITNLKKSKSVNFHPEAFIHSDQGVTRATRSRVIYCRKTTPSIRGNSIVTSVNGNVWVRKLTRQCGNSSSLNWDNC